LRTRIAAGARACTPLAFFVELRCRNTWFQLNHGEREGVKDCEYMANSSEQPRQEPVNNGEQQVIAGATLRTYNMR